MNALNAILLETYSPKDDVDWQRMDEGTRDIIRRIARVVQIQRNEASQKFKNELVAKVFRNKTKHRKEVTSQSTDKTWPTVPRDWEKSLEDSQYRAEMDDLKIQLANLLNSFDAHQVETRNLIAQIHGGIYANKEAIAAQKRPNVGSFS